MSEVEKVELARYKREIVDDLRHLVKKYVRIMEWDIPDVDEKEARALIIKALAACFDEIEAEG
jgi:hypothetical protein